MPVVMPVVVILAASLLVYDSANLVLVYLLLMVAASLVVYYVVYFLSMVVPAAPATPVWVYSRLMNLAMVYCLSVCCLQLVAVAVEYSHRSCVY